MTRICCAAALVCFLLGGCGEDERSAPPEPQPGGSAPAEQSRTYADPLTGWTIDVPAGLHVERIEVTENRREAEGAVLASFALPTPAVEWASAFPADGVALEIARVSPYPSPDLAQPEERFPLRLRELRRAGWPSGSPAGTKAREGSFSANGWPMRARAWIGPEASAADRKALRQAVLSLRFPGLEEATAIGSGFLVLGEASAYPVGSVTRFDSDHPPALGGLPFYVVHAPHGFYALAHVFPQVRPIPPCEVRFQPARFTFACPDIGARWDRIGRVLANPDPRRYVDTPLALLVAKIGQDGHLLVTDGIMSLPDRRHERSFWGR
jgi:hypothetical protein